MPTLTPTAAIAAFDFDGTLTRGDTLIPFLARGLGWPRLLLALVRCAPWLAGYALRLLPNDVAKAHLLRATLSGRSCAEVDGWARTWLDKDLPAQLQDWTMARLAWHQEAGHCCVLVSASPDIYLRHVARQLGFDSLICTELQVQADAHGEHLTGRMQTPNCYGEQKVLRLQAWQAARFGEAAAQAMPLYAYGDTAGDKPMLRLAQHAWYRGEPWQSDVPSV